MAYQIVNGSCLDILTTLPEACIDAVCTDPPYELGFMGKQWDKSGVAFDPKTWAAVLRVLKPGGHMLAFSGTRTYHRMVCAIEDAGFEIRDQLAWLFGSGFPKSKNIAMSIDKGEGVIGHRSRAAVTCSVNDCSGGRGPDRSVGPYVPEDDTPGAAWAGWGTALKPAQEPIVLARKPLIGTVAANVLAHGTGGINVDGGRIGTEIRFNAAAGNKGDEPASLAPVNVTGYQGRECVGRWPANVLLDETAAGMLDAVTACLKGGTAVRRNGVSGGATSIIRAKPEGTPDLGYGDTGGASRFFYTAKASKSEREAGLDDATMLCQCTAEELSCIADSTKDTVMVSGGSPAASADKASRLDASIGISAQRGGRVTDDVGRATSRSSSEASGIAVCLRCGKWCTRPGAGSLTGGREEGSDGLKSPRAGAGRTSAGRFNIHSTVKPIALMRYLCRLITPPGGVVLDPFAGSGSTLCAAVLEGFHALGCELSQEYVAIANARMEHWRARAGEAA